MKTLLSALLVSMFATQAFAGVAKILSDANAVKIVRADVQERTKGNGTQVFTVTLFDEQGRTRLVFNGPDTLNGVPYRYFAANGREVPAAFDDMEVVQLAASASAQCPLTFYMKRTGTDGAMWIDAVVKKQSCE